MCRIGGYFSLGELTDEQYEARFGIATELMRELIVQGRDAAGFAFFDYENKIRYAKGPITPEEMVLDPKWLKTKEFKPQSMIMHSRLGTKGSEMENENNHPLIIEEGGEEQLALIHNGCISNDGEIRRGNKDFNWKAEVDTEVIPTLIHENLKAMSERAGVNPDKDMIISAIKESTKDLSGSFACAMLNKNTPKTLYLFKHTNPIVLAYCKQLNTIFFASTEQIINNAFSLGGENVENAFGMFPNFKDYDYTTREMTENEMIVLNLKDDGNLEVINDKFEAKEYKWTGYSGGNYGHGQGDFFGEFEDGEYDYMGRKIGGSNKPFRGMA